MKTTEDTEDTERILNGFVDEIWDAVCRLRVGSGLTNEEIVRALRQVMVLVRMTDGE